MIPVTHRFKKKSLTVDGNSSFLLSNRNGGYAYIGCDSKYCGVFFYLHDRMIKVIDEIKVGGEAQSLTNNLYSVSQKKGTLNETHFMPFGTNSYVVTLSSEQEISLSFDIRESFTKPTFGREFELFTKGSHNVLKYTHDGMEYFVVFNSNKVIGEGTWNGRAYSEDIKRGDDGEYHTYSGLSLKTKQMIITFGDNLDSVIAENKKTSRSLDSLKEKAQKHISDRVGNRLNIDDPKHYMAYVNAINSLDCLIYKDRLFAGFPWFFQEWTRDSLISLGATELLGYAGLYDTTLQRMKTDQNGNLPNQVGDYTLIGSDSIGWLFKRLGVMRDDCITIVDNLLEHCTHDGYAINGPLETWMDTSIKGDDRSGVRIEIQALRLGIYAFMYKMTNDLRYLDLEIGLKKKVREHFWNGYSLKDGIDDETIRPNIFLAHYVYPNLLTNDEWKRCFDLTVSHLWCNWGGLSSIDKKSPLFCSQHTGKNNQSYHRGDSWFWLNNLAALCLNKIDADGFHDRIQGIIDASCNDILSRGAIGHASEISSAETQTAQGCVAQAWSSALFIELMHQIHSK